MRFAAHGWLYVLALVPLLWLLLGHGDAGARRALRSLLGERAPAHLEGIFPRLRRQRRLLLLAGLVALIVALARPQWGARELTVRERGTDVVVVLDVSNSMLAEDALPSRLVQARAALDGFLSRLDRGRVGIVLFAGSAYVQCPLTLDYATARLFLGQASPDMITAQGTGLAAALATARGLLERGAASGSTTRRAILLVSDGEDFGGGWTEEATRCRDAGLVILAASVGTTTGGLIPVRDERGREAGYLKDEAGQVVLTRADPAALEQLARATGGTVVPTGPAGPDLAGLRGAIARLGERDLEERRISAYEERFMWPLAIALILLTLRELVFPWPRGEDAAGERRARPAGRGLAAAWRARRARRAAGIVTSGLVVPLFLAAAASAAPGLRPAGAAEADRGREHYKAGRYEEALRAFTAARALSPGDPRLTLAVGEALARLGRGKEAVEEFRRATAQSDGAALRAESLYNAGTTLLAGGDAAAAAGALRESLSLDPGRDDALRNLEIAVREQQQQQDQKQQQQQQQQQDQQQQQQQQQQQEQQQQQQEQQQEQQQQQQQPDQQPREERSPQGQMTREQAQDLLRALDRDESELRRAVQKRLQGPPTPGGKRW